ncbi:hypothetical protein B0T24DRAFT_636714 [Lasiosphaeria ovina]|uniref:RAD52 homolog n=1 Tax=Lasiosphaeria ovina TaxID=92902 RepID=A0AAE0JWR5_9PEZI|nr:hypothetical protein B0T24DRAFT_636714 [Lasiosphaeria ovina]
MPAPGDQHSVIANPFQEQTNRVSQYTAQEIATLQSRLQKQLGPEYISSRQGPSGQKVHYITAEKCIALANEVFGFNGWSSSIQNIQVDFVDEHEQTFKISLGLSVVVRVTLRDGTYHEDVGYGHIENCKGKAAAFEKAKKEGTTDALKRALRNFGNVLGNCIYDKAYLAKVTKMKVEPNKFDTDRLHRHSDFAIKSVPPAKVEDVAKPNNSAVPPPPQLISADSFEDLLGEFDEADFNIAEEGHPDEVVLTNSNQGNSNSNQAISGDRSMAHAANSNNASMQPPSRALTRSTSAGNPPSRYQSHTPNPNQQSPRPNNVRSFNAAQNNVPQGGAPRPQQPQQFNQNRSQPPVQQQHGNHQNAQAQMTPPPQPGGQNGGPAAPPGEAVGFFSARAVKELPEDTLNGGQVAPKAGQVFNPHAESPSIRKTPGIDHTKSKPLSRTGQHVPPSVSAVEGASAGGSNTGSPGVGSAIAGGGAPPLTRPGPPMARGNVINPQFDHARRIGAPGAASPLSNRGQYRPPTMKRPAGPAGAGSGAAGDLGLGSGVAAAGGARPPLSDVSNNPPSANAGGGKLGNSEPDSKRQRIS